MDRSSFLFAAAAMYACHAEHRPEVSDPAPVPAPVAPAPVPSADAPEEPDAAVTSPELDAGVDARAEALDAGSDAPAPPVPSLATLAKMCRSMPVDRSCGGDARRTMCQTVLAELDRPAAARAILCHAELESSCDPCGVRMCVQNALYGFPRRTVPECESVQKKVTETSDEGYGKVMFDLCEEYASGMNARGRKRFTRCLRDNVGLGVRYCLWDPSATPCTEGSGRDRSPLPEF